MSFIEANRRWLLPLLAGLVLLVPGRQLLRARLAPARQAGPSQAAPTTAPASPAFRDRPMPVGQTGGKPPLGMPAKALNEVASLLLAARQPLNREQRSLPAPPSLHPQRWRRLPDLVRHQPALASAAGTAAVPPEPDFLIDVGNGGEAWVAGKGYRLGEVLGNGYVLRRITSRGIVVSGPGGTVACPLKPAGPLPVRPDAPAAPSMEPQ